MYETYHQIERLTDYKKFKTLYLKACKPAAICMFECVFTVYGQEMIIWWGMLNIVVQVHISRSSVRMIWSWNLWWWWGWGWCAGVDIVPIVSPSVPSSRGSHQPGDVLIPAAGPGSTIDHRQGGTLHPAPWGACGRWCGTQWWRGNCSNRGSDGHLW